MRDYMFLIEAEDALSREEFQELGTAVGDVLRDHGIPEVPREAGLISPQHWHMALTFSAPPAILPSLGTRMGAIPTPPGATIALYELTRLRLVTGDPAPIGAAPVADAFREHVRQARAIQEKWIDARRRVGPSLVRSTVAGPGRALALYRVAVGWFVIAADTAQGVEAYLLPGLNAGTRAFSTLADQTAAGPLADGAVAAAIQAEVSGWTLKGGPR